MLAQPGLLVFRRRRVVWLWLSTSYRLHGDRCDLSRRLCPRARTRKVPWFYGVGRVPHFFEETPTHARPQIRYFEDYPLPTTPISGECPCFPVHNRGPGGRMLVPLHVKPFKVLLFLLLSSRVSTTCLRIFACSLSRSCLVLALINPAAPDNLISTDKSPRQKRFGRQNSSCRKVVSRSTSARFIHVQPLQKFAALPPRASSTDKRYAYQFIYTNPTIRPGRNWD